MKQKIPLSPFTTRLSGSAKETELRLRSIFQWKKKRPPIIAFVAAILVIALCGSLVGFRTTAPENPPIGDPVTETTPSVDDPVTENTPSMDDPVQETPTTPSDTNDPSVVLAAMASVKAEDFTNPEYFGNVTAEQLAAALNAAVEHQISEEEFLSHGCDNTQIFFHWKFDALLEDEHDNYSSQNRHFSIYCGLPENIVKVTLSEDSHRDTAYFKDETLYQLVRHRNDYEEIIDQDAYAQFKDLLVPKMESALSVLENNPGNFTGYELTRFTPIWRYEDSNGNPVVLYDFFFGLLTDTPETIGWAGGTALDSKLRLIGLNFPVQFAVQYREDGIRTAFMDPEFYYNPTYSSSADWAKEHINTALDQAEAQMTTSSISQVLPADARQPVLDYLRQEYIHAPVYYLGEEPSAPQEGNWRIDRVTYQGETRLYETVGRAYDLSFSTYSSSRWNVVSPICLVLSFSIDGTLNAVEGISHVTTESMPAEYIIKQVANNLMDLEVSLMRDGYAWPAGPGSRVQFHREVYDGPETVEILENWEPIYSDGDYWALHSWNGFEALCYHRADTGTYAINRIDTTRTDLFTHRGIRMGDSRADVMAAYPELKSGDYWGLYSGEDILWYCNDPNDFGAALIFFFENDAVSRIVLNNMFN